jgi:ABC-type transport system involved in cytochrome c biogenesis permease subunit
MPLDRVTILCFAASYAVALGLELVQLAWPRPIQRVVCLLFAAAGLLAHTIYLFVQQPTLASQFGSLLFLAWVLAVFYLSESIHYRQQSRGVFVLPVVLGLTLWARTISYQSTASNNDASLATGHWPLTTGNWGYLHAGLLVLAAVGICIGFVASVMYLVQIRQLRNKMGPGHGLKLPSLERLERMNRWAINLAFPLLTAGVCIGIGLMFLSGNQGLSWTDPRIVSTAILWLVFALLLYMRYGVHLNGRRLAQLTIVAFVLLLFTLASSHAFEGGIPP